MSKKFGTDNFAKGGRHAGRKENANDRGNCSPNSHQRHNAAGAPDVANIFIDNPVIDDIRHQSWQVQIGDGLHEGECHNENEYWSVRLHEPQQFDHTSLSPFKLTIYRILFLIITIYRILSRASNQHFRNAPYAFQNPARYSSLPQPAQP